MPRILHVYVDAQSRALVDNVRSLADSVGTKALLSLAGTDAAAATFHDSAVDLARRLGPGAVFLFDAQGALLARSDREAGEEAGRDFSAVSWVAGPLYTGQPASAFILEITRRRSLALIAAAPVFSGQGDEARVTGVIAITAPLGEAQARDIGGLVSGEAVLVANVARRGKPLDLGVLAASPQLRRATPDVLLDEPTREAVFARGKDVAGFDFTAGGERYTGAAVALTTGGGEPIAALLAARPKSPELAAFRALRGSVLAVGLLALALSLPLSFAFARRTSRPIEQLAAGAEALRQGRLDVELPKARDAEVKTLARAFGALVIELEEKRALERLLAQTRRSDTAEIVVGEASGADPDFITPRPAPRAPLPHQGGARRRRHGPRLPRPRPRPRRGGGDQGVQPERLRPSARARCSCCARRSRWRAPSPTPTWCACTTSASRAACASSPWSSSPAPRCGA